MRRGGARGSGSSCAASRCCSGHCASDRVESANPAIAAGAPVQVFDLEKLRIAGFAVLPDGRLFGVLTTEFERNEVTEQHLVLDSSDR